MPDIKCDVCTKTFPSHSRIVRHMRQMHKIIIEKQNPLGRPSSGSIICDHCGKGYYSKYYLNIHIKKAHNIPLSVPTGKFQCCVPSCGCGFKTRIDYARHLINMHEEETCGSGTISEMWFETWGDFETWKRSIEIESVTKFSRDQAKKKEDDKVVTYYLCFRSGTYKPRGTGRRRIKVHGSAKIGKLCPAFIKTVQCNGIVAVTYCDIHVKHSMDISFIPLSRFEKNSKDIPDVVKTAPAKRTETIETVNACLEKLSGYLHSPGVSKSIKDAIKNDLKTLALKVEILVKNQNPNAIIVKEEIDDDLLEPPLRLISTRSRRRNSAKVKKFDEIDPLSLTDAHIDEFDNDGDDYEEDDEVLETIEITTAPEEEENLECITTVPEGGESVIVCEESTFDNLKYPSCNALLADHPYASIDVFQDIQTKPERIYRVV